MNNNTPATTATAIGAPAGRSRGTRRRRLAAALVLACLPVLGVAPPAQAVVPAISAVSPTVGVNGTSVRITGMGFSATPANNTVTFGTVRATVTAASATVLTATAPLPRVSSKMRVRTAGGLSSSRDFYMPPAPYAAANVAFTARSSIGGSASVVHPLANKVGIVLFDGQAGQRVAVDVTDSTFQQARIRVYRPDGTVLKAVTTGLRGVFTDTLTLSLTGTYSVVVDSQTSAGRATVRILNVPPDNTGTIARGAAQTVSTTAIGQSAVRTFSGTAGQRVALEFSAATLTGTPAPRARLLFVQPNGTKLGVERLLNEPERLTGNPLTTGLVDTVTLSVTGTYRVKFDPLHKATGSVRLLLHAVPADDSGPLVFDALQTMTTSVPGQKAWRSFTANAGDRFRTLFGAITYERADVRVFYPAGGIVVLEDIIAVPGGPTVSDMWTVPATGTYRVEVDPYEQATGSITLYHFRVPPDETGTLTPGVPSLVTVAAMGQSAHRTFTGTAGQTVVLDFADNTLFTSLSLFPPNGQQLLREEYLDGDHDSLRVRLAQTGTYTLTFAPFREGGTGTVTTTLWVAPADNTGTIAVGGPPQVVTLAPAQRGARTFSVAAPRELTLTVTGNTLPGSTTLVVDGPAGQIPVGSPITTPTDERRLEVVVAGTYTVRIRPEHAGSGSITLQLN